MIRRHDDATMCYHEVLPLLVHRDLFGLCRRVTLERDAQHAVRYGRIDLIRIHVFGDVKSPRERAPIGLPDHRNDAVFERHVDAGGVEAWNRHIDDVAAFGSGLFEAVIPVAHHALEWIEAEQALKRGPAGRLARNGILLTVSYECRHGVYVSPFERGRSALLRALF